MRLNRTNVHKHYHDWVQGFDEPAGWRAENEIVEALCDIIETADVFEYGEPAKKTKSAERSKTEELTVTLPIDLDNDELRVHTISDTLGDLEEKISAQQEKYQSAQQETNQRLEVTLQRQNETFQSFKSSIEQALQIQTEQLQLTQAAFKTTVRGVEEHFKASLNKLTQGLIVFIVALMLLSYALSFGAYFTTK